jgi:hypothetical protein
LSSRHIGPQNFLDSFSDRDLIHPLHVGQTIKKQDALDQLVRVLHLLNRLGVFLLSNFVTPQCSNTGHEKILIDGGQFIGELGVQVFNDFGSQHRHRLPDRSVDLARYPPCVEAVISGGGLDLAFDLKRDLNQTQHRLDASTIAHGNRRLRKRPWAVAVVVATACFTRLSVSALHKQIYTDCFH